jgi:hypothetical protein
MCVAYKTVCYPLCVVVSWMIQPSDTGVSRLHSPIEADDRGAAKRFCVSFRVVHRALARSPNPAGRFPFAVGLAR